MTAPQTSKTGPASHLPLVARLRVPGILFATAALTLMMPGALSVEAPAAILEPAGQTEVAGPVQEDAAAPAGSQGPAPADEGTLSFRTGDRLDAQQLEEFEAYVAGLRAKGQYKGISQW